MYGHNNGGGGHSSTTTLHSRIRHTSTRHYHRQPLRRLQSVECSTPCRKTPRRRRRAEEKQVSSFPATYSLLPLAKSTCGEVGPDVHALVKELVIRRVEHRSETNSNESQYLAEGTKVGRLRRYFSFVLQQTLSFRTRHHLCRQGVALASARQLRSQGPVLVEAHRIEGVIASEGREGASGVRSRNGVGGGN